MTPEKIKIGITQGDINSISYEVIIKALNDSRILDICTPVVYGSPKVAAYHRKALNIDNFSFNNIKSPEEANPKRANIINCLDDSVRVELGKSTKIAGEASYLALEMAVNDLEQQKINALVTGPINKHNIQSERFNFAGHTEYLESKLMKVGIVTGHVQFSRIIEYLTRDVILNKLRIMNKSLLTDFMIRRPKIAVLGLNPHASDNGLIGNEEQEIIMPALDMAREENMMVFGPFPPDGFFGSGSFARYDAVLAMYHDQGLIPFKALMAGSGVNFTAGLPVVRTSPAHGTSFELAGKGEACPDSFREAIYLASDIYKNRQIYNELTANPLKSYNITES
jgi:4-hydroxythreonine-4-phosphate dehydrogenase